MCGHPTRVTTGTDEHGLKVQQAARARGTPVREFCDQVSGTYRDLFAEFGVEHDDFIRTSEPRHAKSVTALWERVRDNGFIAKGRHAGWYCVSDEAFLTESQTQVVDGARVSVESGHPVEWIEEENYVFRLSAFQDRLLEWLESHPGAIVPKSRQREVEQFVRAGLRDLSVSRPKERIEWGVSVPGDDSQTVYVWMDALANYLTVCGGAEAADQFWPADTHIIGKDILRFHAVYWPAFLMAAGLPLPRRIAAHAHWTVEGRKMSKSIGNVVDGKGAMAVAGERFARHQRDVVRYYLLREGGLANDGDFSPQRLQEVCAAELADVYGNLVARVTGKKMALPTVRAPSASHFHAEDRELASQVGALEAVMYETMDRIEPSASLQAITETLRHANRFFSAMEPWRLRHSDPERHEAVLHSCLRAISACSVALQPFIPTAASEVLDHLKCDPQKRKAADISAWRDTTFDLGAGALVLFPKTPKHHS